MSRFTCGVEQAARQSALAIFVEKEILSRNEFRAGFLFVKTPSIHLAERDDLSTV
jgi:hypothetical protein